MRSHRFRSLRDVRGVRSGSAAGAAVLSALLLLACGGEPPEAQLAQAGERAAEQRAEVRALEETLKEKRQAVEEAAEALATARAEFEAAEKDLAQAKARVDARATEVALFRAVQGSLLDVESLEDVAIRVSVEGDAVTLRGQVHRPDQAEVAMATARRTPGVTKVVNELTVRSRDGS